MFAFVHILALFGIELICTTPDYGEECETIASLRLGSLGIAMLFLLQLMTLDSAASINIPLIIVWQVVDLGIEVVRGTNLCGGIINLWALAVSHGSLEFVQDAAPVLAELPGLAHMSCRLCRCSARRARRHC